MADPDAGADEGVVGKVLECVRDVRSTCALFESVGDVEEGARRLSTSNKTEDDLGEVWDEREKVKKPEEDHVADGDWYVVENVSSLRFMTKEGMFSNLFDGSDSPGPDTVEGILNQVEELFPDDRHVSEDDATVLVYALVSVGTVFLEVLKEMKRALKEKTRPSATEDVPADVLEAEEMSTAGANAKRLLEIAFSVWEQMAPADRPFYFYRTYLDAVKHTSPSSVANGDLEGIYELSLARLSSLEAAITSTRGTGDGGLNALAVQAFDVVSAIRTYHQARIGYHKEEGVFDAKVESGSDALDECATAIFGDLSRCTDLLLIAMERLGAIDPSDPLDIQHELAYTYEVHASCAYKAARAAMRKEHAGLGLEYLEIVVASSEAAFELEPKRIQDPKKDLDDDDDDEEADESSLVGVARKRRNKDLEPYGFATGNKVQKDYPCMNGVYSTQQLGTTKTRKKVAKLRKSLYLQG